ncbi:MAG: hypothetical protein QXM01_02015 [Candidatus Bathyarchaeia archaeon]
MSERSLLRRCLFVKSRECLVDADEIPLEVCRLCIEAWKIQASTIMVRREVVKTLEAVGVPTALLELDHMFENGEIELDDYIEKREKILESLKRQTYSKLEEPL